MTISREHFSNALETTLNGAINNSVTSIVVTDASTFPETFFRIKIDDELIFCTSRSTNTLTVVRGQEGTTAASHIDTSPVNHVITAKALQEFRKGILADVGLIDPNDSLSADDDDFDDENFSGWTLVERTSYEATIVERNHRASFLIPANTDGQQFYGYVKAKVPSAGDYIQAGFQSTGAGSAYPMMGVVFANGNTYNAGKQANFTWSPYQQQFYRRDFDNWNSNTGYVGSSVIWNTQVTAMHLRMVWESSNHYTCLVSPDCINWSEIFNNANFGTVGTPSHVGLTFSNWGTTVSNVMSATYCRFSW